MKEQVRIVADQLVNGEVHRTCPKCQATKPLDEFGLRRVVGSKGPLTTNQSWCRICRKRPARVSG